MCIIPGSVKAGESVNGRQGWRQPVRLVSREGTARCTPSPLSTPERPRLRFPNTLRGHGFPRSRTGETLLRQQRLFSFRLKSINR